MSILKKFSLSGLPGPCTEQWTPHSELQLPQGPGWDWSSPQQTQHHWAGGWAEQRRWPSGTAWTSAGQRKLWICQVLWINVGINELLIVWVLAASTLPDCITGLPPLVDVSLCEVFFWHEVKNCPHFKFIWIYSWKRENHRVECEEQKRGNIDCFHCDLDIDWICMNTTDQWMITNWIKM